MILTTLLFQTADEYVLLSLLLLFCPDLLDLEERRRVEEMQLKYLIVLQKYLNKKYQDPFLRGMLYI